jgi:hypothetical protein
MSTGFRFKLVGNYQKSWKIPENTTIVLSKDLTDAMINGTYHTIILKNIITENIQIEGAPNKTTVRTKIIEVEKNNKQPANSFVLPGLRGCTLDYGYGDVTKWHSSASPVPSSGDIIYITDFSSDGQKYYGLTLMYDGAKYKFSGMDNDFHSQPILNKEFKTRTDLNDVFLNKPILNKDKIVGDVAKEPTKNVYYPPDAKLKRFLPSGSPYDPFPGVIPEKGIETDGIMHIYYPEGTGKFTIMLMGTVYHNAPHNGFS